MCPLQTTKWSFDTVISFDKASAIITYGFMIFFLFCELYPTGDSVTDFKEIFEL